MYENSIVPERLPGGGGFSIKNFSLWNLYQENIHGHNIFTHTNEPYPLVRYTGCTLKLYQSQNIDYIVTYNNTWPLQSSLKMYNSMQPQIHYLQKNKIIVPSKITRPNKRKPYKKVFIPPPSQMKNQWYFQSNLAKTPLFMLLTTCTSLDHWYIGTRQKSTNITIYTLNTGIIFNRNFDQYNIPYFSRQIGTVTYYLYGTNEEVHDSNKLTLTNLVFLGNTKHNWEGQSYNDAFHTTQNKGSEWKKPNMWGNPFHAHWLHNFKVYNSPATVDEIAQQIDTNINSKVENLPRKQTFTAVELISEVRYNPNIDDGTNNECYFLSAKQPGGHSWDGPGNPDLTNNNLPLWLLLYGFSDFQKKIGKLQHIDTDYLFTIKTTKTTPIKPYIVPISYSFVEGYSPYEDKPNPIDENRWYPCFQYQQEMYTQICLTGPGTPKIAAGDTVEAKIHYNFHFKWGGELPNMAKMEDPTEQPSYIIPNNFLSTTSLQNPTTAPETYLYSFDERQGFLTKKAAKRIRKDWQTEKHSLLPTEPRFGETPKTQASQEETTSEEDEETDLYTQLQQQRLKQQRLKHRIRSILSQIQNIQ